MKRLLVLALLVPSMGLAGEDDDAPPYGDAPPAGDAAADTSPALVEALAEAEPGMAELTPRERYNQGLGQLVAGNDEAAAEDFLAARDTAGPDPELRYRAAFNLGLALAAGVAPDAPPETAIETLRQSAAWFNDAVRLAPVGDDDARINLELVSQRILVLADQLNEGDRLESRLDRLTDDQRGVRDQVRQLLAAVEAEGAGTEPLGFKSEFDALASRERTLMAEIGETIELAAEERLFIEQLPDEQRTPEQQGRAYQLAGVADYLERARQSLSDARRLLRRLTGERAHRRADAALAEMKRAREQLFDPVTVLKSVGRDQSTLIDHAAALAANAGAIRLQQGPPPWLTHAHLAERQHDAAARTGGVLGRFDALTATGTAVENTQEDPTVRVVAMATPILDDGLAAMRAAIRALESDDAATALPEQNRASAALREAIEQFAGLRDLIELAYAGQQGIVSLLTPGEEESSSADLSPADRARAITAVANANQRRLERLGALLQEEADASAAQVAPEDTDASAADQQARQAEAERYQLAGALRTTAMAGLATLVAEVAAILDGAGEETVAREAAAETLTSLTELRRLFFSIVEHLHELHAEQTSTHDTTATLQFEASADAVDALAAGLGLAAQRQSDHAQMADALAMALAEQADATNAAAAEQGSPASGESAQDAAARLVEAAEEVRKAGGRMHGAGTLLADAVARASNMSPELEPALTDQGAAIEHLENALRALSPPDEDQQGQGDQQQQQQAQSQPREDEQMSQRQALKRLQAIRDREAERQRRRQSDPARAEPVEKDW